MAEPTSASTNAALDRRPGDSHGNPPASRLLRYRGCPCFFKSVLWGLSLASLVVLGGIEPASAGGATQSYKTTAWVVGIYTATPGERRDAFVLRVAQVLKGWTDETGTEACGVIARDDAGALQVVLTTERSQVVCLIPISAPGGGTLTGDSIHSHPADGGRHKVRLTVQDLAALRALGRGGFVDMLRRMDIRQVDAEPDTFSVDDYATGHGYLVVGDSLLYQHGPGTATRVAVLPR